MGQGLYNARHGTRPADSAAATQLWRRKGEKKKTHVGWSLSQAVGLGVNIYVVLHPSASRSLGEAAWAPPGSTWSSRDGSLVPAGAQSSPWLISFTKLCDFQTSFLDLC